MKAILAMAKNRCIGKDGKLPWHYSEDFKWFKEFTMGHTLVVGRKTFDTLPPLKKRSVCVITNNSSKICKMYEKRFDKFENLSFLNPKQVLEEEYDYWKDGIIAGGKSTYELFMPHITEFYVTCINQEYDGDTFIEPFEHLFDKQIVLKEFDFGNVVKYEKTQKEKTQKEPEKIVSAWCNYCMSFYDYHKGCACERESERR